MLRAHVLRIQESRGSLMMNRVIIADIIPRAPIETPINS